MPNSQKKIYVPICFHVPSWLSDEINKMVAEGAFINRSDAVRELLAIGWTVWRVLARLKQYENKEKEAEEALEKMLLQGREVAARGKV